MEGRLLAISMDDGSYGLYSEVCHYNLQVSDICYPTQQ